MQGDMKEFLQQENWAVIGVSDNPEKYGTKVYLQLKKAGYKVYAVNPKLDQIDGDTCYPNLSSLPLVPDAVSVVVPPKATEQIINECAKLGIRRIWMQPGSESDTAIKDGDDQGLELVYSQCVLIQTRDKVK
ncbi:CoA-binding protein [Desulfitobacterium metallireducens]|uniref:CoA-binding protein n=1 Tax=Desulfitobacterium metallireducens DSM 15288 TaxID=871968 RepID=W0E9E4_9FIRM|nr:CoA-binding protein [Desulfitobacterium metallireducens]AHF07495.1 CoA-binding protein [Desulfitobacterium metallireducens DSM 15288]